VVIGIKLILFTQTDKLDLRFVNLIDEKIKGGQGRMEV
jgi:hypothetical protein